MATESGSLRGVLGLQDCTGSRRRKGNKVIRLLVVTTLLYSSNIMHDCSSTFMDWMYMYTDVDL